MNSSGKLSKVFDKALEILAVISGLILLFLMISVCIDVTMRYLLNRPLSWVIEIAEYLLVYMTFLGAAWVQKLEGHVRVDVLTMMLSPRNQSRMAFVSAVIGVFVFATIVVFGTIETWDTFERGVRNPSMLEFPKAPILAVIPFGSFFFMIQFLRKAHGLAKEIRLYKKDSRGS
jgi:TRAP-type C4-dicarboxylate transport system permease small subunit